MKGRIHRLLGFECQIYSILMEEREEMDKMILLSLLYTDSCFLPFHFLCNFSYNRLVAC